MEQIKLIRIDSRIIWQVLLIAAIAYMAYTFTEVIIMFFIAFILYAGLKPAVEYLESKGLPRSVAILIIFITVLLLILVGGVLVTRQFVEQGKMLIEQLPNIVQSFATFVRNTFPALSSLLPLDALTSETSKFIQQIINSEALNQFLASGNLFALAARAVGIFGTAAGLLLELFTIVMVSVYLLARKQSPIDQLAWIIPKKWLTKSQRVYADTELSLGAWMRGQLLLMLIIGLATYLILFIPGLFIPTYKLDDYALPIAIFAGLLELLPTVGPAITLVLAGVLAVGTGGLAPFIYVLASFLALQNLESILIVPAVMKKAVGIDPIVTILAIVGAFSAFGIVGAILVVPVVVIIKILLREMASEN